MLSWSVTLLARAESCIPLRACGMPAAGRAPTPILGRSHPGGPDLHAVAVAELGATRRSSYRGHMSILLEAIGAVVQAIVEAAAEVLTWSRSENKQDGAPDE